MGWGSKEKILLMGWQEIVNYCDGPSKNTSSLSRQHKMLVPKYIWHDQQEMFVKKSPYDRLVSFAGFVAMILLALLFLLLLPNWFFSVCLHPFFAAVLRFFLPPATSALFGRADLNKSRPKSFAVGTFYLRNIVNAVLPISFSTAPKPLPCCRRTPLKNRSSVCLDATFYWHCFRWDGTLQSLLNTETKRVRPTVKNGIPFSLVSHKSRWTLRRGVSSSGLNCSLLNVG